MRPLRAHRPALAVALPPPLRDLLPREMLQGVVDLLVRANNAGERALHPGCRWPTYPSEAIDVSRKEARGNWKGSLLGSSTWRSVPLPGSSSSSSSYDRQRGDERIDDRSGSLNSILTRATRPRAVRYSLRGAACRLRQSTDSFFASASSWSVSPPRVAGLHRSPIRERASRG